MHSFTAIIPSKFTCIDFGLFINKSTYAFLNFIPQKNSPQRQQFKIQKLNFHQEVLEEKTVYLELANDKKQFEEHSIDMVCDASQHRLIFTPIIFKDEIQNLDWTFTVAVVKIKDGNDDDDDSRNRFNPVRPRSPVLLEIPCESQVKT